MLVGDGGGNDGMDKSKIYLLVAIGYIFIADETFLAHIIIIIDGGGGNGNETRHTQA